MASAFIASGIADKLDPNATGQTKLLETAVTNVGVDTAGAAAGGLAYLAGAPVVATASTVAAEVAAPTVVAYETGDAVYKGMSKATEKMKNRLAAGALLRRY